MTIFLATFVFLAGAAEPPRTGQIAFLSGEDPAGRCVCILDLSTNRVQLVGMGEADGPPVWSPDGAWLAFESATEQGVAIAICKADGSGRRLLPRTARLCLNPTWSPLPEDKGIYRPRLAYSRCDGDPVQSVIGVFDLDSGQEEIWGSGGNAALHRPVWINRIRILTAFQAGLSELGGEEAARWANVNFESRNVLFAIGAVGKPGSVTTNLFVVMPEGALPLPAYVLPSPGVYEEWTLAIHPKGKKLALESNDGGDREVYLISEKGAYSITNHHAADWNPVWSPDGEMLAFESLRDGPRGVYIVNASTGMVTPIAVDADAQNWSPAWSPDGHWIVYVSNREGAPRLRAAASAGGGQFTLPPDDSVCHAPAWRPGE